MAERDNRVDYIEANQVRLSMLTAAVANSISDSSFAVRLEFDAATADGVVLAYGLATPEQVTDATDIRGMNALVIAEQLNERTINASMTYIAQLRALLAHFYDQITPEGILDSEISTIEPRSYYYGKIDVFNSNIDPESEITLVTVTATGMKACERAAITVLTRADNLQAETTVLFSINDKIVEARIHSQPAQGELRNLVMATFEPADTSIIFNEIMTGTFNGPQELGKLLNNLSIKYHGMSQQLAVDSLIVNIRENAMATYEANVQRRQLGTDQPNTAYLDQLVDIAAIRN